MTLLVSSTVLNGRRLWLDVIILSVAIHLKVYPAIMASLLLWRYGLRVLLPLLALNVALLFSFGPYYALQWMSCLAIPNALKEVTGLGSHSAMSFFACVVEGSMFAPAWVGTTLLCIPLVLWLSGFLIVFSNGWSARNAMLLFAVSVPIMNVVPSVSWDFRLVILYPVIALLIYSSLHDYVHHGRRTGLLFGATVMLVAIFLGRPTLPAQCLWLSNKYLFVIALQLLSVLAMLLFAKDVSWRWARIVGVSVVTVLALILSICTIALMLPASRCAMNEQFDRTHQYGWYGTGVDVQNGSLFLFPATAANSSFAEVPLTYMRRNTTCVLTLKHSALEVFAPPWPTWRLSISSADGASNYFSVVGTAEPTPRSQTYTIGPINTSTGLVLRIANMSTNIILLHSISLTEMP